ncbi:MAG: YebC/PmpR family DNA-binding transcriptional regulator [Clostridia bacterium]|nr:YebC/PmpR family DNA-binding transcriptional regulator [Clostridia bacterium]
MSGHSKWHNIQAKKGKADAQKAKIFTKFGREIAVAVKAGGPDPNSNAKLYDAIQKAKQNNMPNDRIQNGIKKASGELSAINYEQLVYEGYGCAGVAVIVETLTDNKNRTGGDVRYVFDKSGGQMGTTGCVSFMFDRRGIIVIDKEENPGLDFDTLMDYCLEGGADDITEEDDCFEVLTTIPAFSSACKFLEAQNVKIASSEMGWIPQNTVEIPEDKIETFEKMLDRFDELDDVQNVFHNAANV